MTATTRVLTPEEIAARQVSDAPHLRLPERATLFGEREMRLRQRASGHAMRDYLLFVADLVHAQGDLLQAHTAVPVPDASSLARAGAAGMPPLPATEWTRDPAWRTLVAQLARALARTYNAGPVGETLLRLQTAPDDFLEQQADKLLAGISLDLDLAAAPVIGAALQVHFSHLVLEVQRLYGHLREQPFGRIDDPAACPCCGSRPVASITRPEGGVNGQRYLACSLCSAQWHRVRIQCARCGSDKVNYQSLQAVDDAAADGLREGALQAECCDACGHYLKIVHMEKDPHVEPAADDLASLTLDILVGEAGVHRHGVNLMLLFAEPDTADASDQGAGP